MTQHGAETLRRDRPKCSAGSAAFKPISWRNAVLLAEALTFAAGDGTVVPGAELHAGLLRAEEGSAINETREERNEKRLLDDAPVLLATRACFINFAYLLCVSLKASSKPPLSLWSRTALCLYASLISDTPAPHNKPKYLGFPY